MNGFCYYDGKAATGGPFRHHSGEIAYGYASGTTHRIGTIPFNAAAEPHTPAAATPSGRWQKEISQTQRV